MEKSEGSFRLLTLDPRLSTLIPMQDEHRILIFGNSGSGKTTMAHALADRPAMAHLDFDDIAWEPDAWGARRSLQETVAVLDEFMRNHSLWVIEGCYGDLIEHVVPHCTELCFLNPGIDTCIANCRKRPREQDAASSRVEYQKLLDDLLTWVRQYESRDDEFSLKRHRAIFESFTGQKQEFTEAWSDSSL